MPSWAENDPREYWDAADLHERANGRLYVSADFALINDLSDEDQAALAGAFAQELTAEEQLPYTLAIHAGKDADGNRGSRTAAAPTTRHRRPYAGRGSREVDMSSAIEMFRQQREAAKMVHHHLLEVSLDVGELQRRTAALAEDEHLRALLRDERNWLAEAHRLVAEVRALRLAVEHRWSATMRRWVLPALFALASAMAAGAGYGALQPRQADDLNSLRDLAAFAEVIQRRLDSMTPAERRLFDRLIKGSGTTR